MLIGYARVSKADGSQSLALQRDALQAAGVDAVHVYHDFASGVRDDRPVRVLTGQGAQIDTTTAAGLLVFGIFAAGCSRCRKPRCGWPRLRWRTVTRPCPHSATNSGSPAEFERELIRERTLAGLTAARGARPQRRQDVRAVESPGAAGPGCDGAP